MRKSLKNKPNLDYKIIAIDDEVGILDSLSIVLKKAGYSFEGFTDPLEAIKRIKTEHYDLLILDFIMSPLHGDQVVEEIRKFNKELYILLLTGHKDLVPPLETIKKLDIQGYCEKSNKFEQLLLLIESGIKSINQVRAIKTMNNELQKSYIDSVETIRQIVEAKDPYTKGHSERVSKLSMLIGEKLELNDSEMEILKVGSLFHDIGKIGIPDNILLKPEKLNDDEYLRIKEHPNIGFNILKHSSMFEECLPLIRHHHEKYDGSGYPDHLKGDEIPYLSRIIAVADTFDAISSKRPYRDCLPIDFAKTEIKRCENIQFDPKIADTFLDILENDFEKIQEIYN